MADDLLTAAEAAYLEEDGSIKADADEELLDGIEEEEVEDLPAVEEKQASESSTDEANEADPIAEYTPEEVPAVEPLPISDRYQEVTMTDTVPPVFEQAMADLAKKFDDSEIEITEYLKQRALIDRQVTAFQIEEANQQKSYNSWMDAQDSFLNENRQYVENRILYSALDSAVSDVKADPRSRGLTPTQIMAAADYLVRDAFAQPQKSTTPKEGVKAEQKLAKPTNDKPNLPTLDRIPASSQNDTGLDPFSAIERLTGDAKEAAVARLTPEQFQQYLSS